MRHAIARTRLQLSKDRHPFLTLILSLALLLPVTACQEGSITASPGETTGSYSDSGSAETGNWMPGFLVSEETETVPAGHQISIRLDHGVSSGANKSGDTFTAILDKPIQINQRTLAPVGTEVHGRLTAVDGSNRVKGRARMSLKVEEIVLDSEPYDLETNALHFEAEATKKEDAAKIGAGAAIGAVIGAIAGGGDGAAKGAAIGGGAGTGLVLTTKGKEVEFGPETLLTFTLGEAVELPVAD